MTINSIGAFDPFLNRIFEEISKKQNLCFDSFIQVKQ